MECIDRWENGKRKICKGSKLRRLVRIKGKEVCKALKVISDFPNLKAS